VSSTSAPEQGAPQLSSRVGAYVLGARPATLPAAAVPVIVGAAVGATTSGDFKPLVFLVTLVAALLIQIGTNFANDYSDFHRGVDHGGRLGPVRVTQSGLLSTHQVKRGIIVSFGLATIAGLYLAWVGGWPIVAIGLASIVAGLAYTGGPWPFGYHALGDLFVFVFFGVVAVTGTAYLQSGEWTARALLASLPIGFLVTNILVINNLRDLPTDRASGKNTLAVAIGDRATRLQYALLSLAAFAVPLAQGLGAMGARWLLLPLLAVPPAWLLVRQVLGGTSGRELNPLLGASGRLLLMFGVLYAAGVLLAR
jgi:1,4-dihydroxy-2-naphthoate octaprenyltransferase